MRKLRWYLPLFVFLALFGRSVSCNPLRLADDGDDGGVPDAPVSTGDLVIRPVNPTIDITVGVPPAATHFTAKTNDGSDVTKLAAWSVDDPTLASIQSGVLTPVGDKGGTTTVRATYGTSEGHTTVKIKLHAAITDACPGCPAFPPPGAPSCGDGSRKPNLVYPPDGPLIPPNMNVIETQFDKGSANSLYEVVFQNDATDVRVTTRCTAITDARNIATTGCSYSLTQMVWDVLIKTNRGGDPINISVRATDDSGSCVATSDTNSIKIAEKDLVGGIYYWQSVTNMGMPGRAGGIYRYDFGKRNQPPDAFLDAAKQGRCIGCHFLSRDGQQMTYGADDADDDDEYGDLSSLLIQVAKKMAVNGETSPGFQTFSPDHKLIIASDGRGSLSPPAFYLLDGETHAAVPPSHIPTGGMRGTHPDWSPDGKSLVYVQPKKFLAQNFISSYDDDHFTGASLMMMTVDIATKTFGAPTMLLASKGENNFYPAFSPDGRFVMFNTVPGTGTDLQQDSFYNLNARISLLSLRPGSSPVDMAALNGGMQGYTNSWPRFCPITQTYKGHSMAWVAFSSTRDYGYRVRNSVKVPNGGTMIDQINCYPPYSPENTGGFGNQQANCHQPQIWMGAIDLTAADGGEAGGLDTSFPAFWLPFQDLNSHNHTAQWVTTIVNEPPPDGGCVNVGNTCTVAGSACCDGNVCIDGLCRVP